MKKVISGCLTLLCLGLFADETNLPPLATAMPAKKFTYVIVQGASGNGWDWKNVDDLLTADGNKVYRATLTGLGENSHLADTNIDLNMHIGDVANLIVRENLHDVVLVGQSYGGMVITGVADHLTDRIKQVVYIDALVPENGESVEKIRLHTTNDPPAVNGLIVPAWVGKNSAPPNDFPQSYKTLTQSITLTNQAIAQSISTTYILTVEKGRQPDQDDFYKFYLRAKARGWKTEIIEGDRNVENSQSEEIVRLLEKAPQ
jgi:pimeloyl-ACP methyl ester carboxylesterase